MGGGGVVRATVARSSQVRVRRETSAAAKVHGRASVGQREGLGDARAAVVDEDVGDSPPAGGTPSDPARRGGLSKVADFSVGSRQEEAQRLGRILCPKAGGGQAAFYTSVAGDTTTRLRRSPPALPG